MGVPEIAPGVPEERRRADRRRPGLWSILYGGVRPRRRKTRRRGDHQQVFLDWHEPRVLFLVLGLIVLSCLDALFTLNLLHLGAEEINLVMNALIIKDVDRFVAVKIGATAVSAVLLAVAAQRHFLGLVPVVRFLELFCAGYAALIAYELYLFFLIFNEQGLWPADWSELAMTAWQGVEPAMGGAGVVFPSENA